MLIIWWPMAWDGVPWVTQVSKKKPKKLVLFLAFGSSDWVLFWEFKSTHYTNFKRVGKKKNIKEYKTTKKITKESMKDIKIYSKRDNMSVNDMEISLKMKSKGWLSKEKDIIKWKKDCIWISSCKRRLYFSFHTKTYFEMNFLDDIF